MQFKVGADFKYDVAQRSTVILNVHALRTPSQEILEEHFSIEPKVRSEEFLSTNGENRYVRLETGKASRLTIHYSARVETHVTTYKRSEIDAVPIAQLDRNVIPYLFPSRYCQSDQLGRLAWNKFGGISHPYEQVAALTEWIHGNVEYLRGSTNSATSAFDTVTQRAGVCRDFAHLGIALCRALSIPARYFSGYSYRLDPPDFHACFEAFIGGRWYIFDPTRLAPLNGLVRIAMGRDAADASIATIFGRMRCTAMSVRCELLSRKYRPWTHRQTAQHGMSLDG
jgi:transglutaminase-like putative cysteine protease